jgi:hypothetical protein
LLPFAPQVQSLTILYGAIDINEAVRSQENRTFLMDMQENMFTTKMTLVKPGPLSADRYSSSAIIIVIE